VLGTGGYQANHELRQQFQPASEAVTPYYGVDTARGDGHVIGQAVGGQLLNMTCIPMYVRAPSGLVEDSIAVNKTGRRFHNEPGPYLERVAALREQPDGVAYYVFDQSIAESKAELVRHLPEAPRSADTLAELAQIVGCDSDVLEETVAAWNSTVAQDTPVDPEFDRKIFPGGGRGILTPPFHAAPMIVGASFTAGGFKMSPDMEVLDIEGAPIPGLMAVGDCVGSVNPASGLGGIHLGSAATLGMVAGRVAATI
jgi:succinate dehydrogenase/fumarate reductase flavoprotein subunit